MSSARPIARRQPKKPGDTLVSVEDMPTQLNRLLRAFERCDDAARGEVLRVAELLADATP